LMLGPWRGVGAVGQFCGAEKQGLRHPMGRARAQTGNRKIFGNKKRSRDEMVSDTARIRRTAAPKEAS